MGAFRALTAGGLSTRLASKLTGLPRAADARDRARPSPATTTVPAPANAFTPTEREEVIAALTSDDLVDLARAQAYARLLDQGLYVGSISTMYRILRAHNQVTERRRQARHAPRARPELVADGPGQVYS